MKQFKDLSAASKATVVALFCRAKGWQDTTDPAFPPANLPTETPVQFVSRLAQEWIVRVALAQRAAEAAATATQAATSDSDLT